MDDESDKEAWIVALAIVLLLLNIKTVRPLTLTQQKRARVLLRAKFEADALRLAVAVAGGAIATARWKEQMQATIEEYARQMAAAGAGTLPDVATRAKVDARLQEQQPYLERFAGVVAAGVMSAIAIAARAKLYGGVGWGAYWTGAENAISRQRGQIVYYTARDDRGTCGPCNAAQRTSPYRAGTNHPVPGSVCLGGGLCRCELRFEYNPTVYAQLG